MSTEPDEESHKVLPAGSDNSPQAVIGAIDPTDGKEPNSANSGFSTASATTGIDVAPLVDTGILEVSLAVTGVAIAIAAASSNERVSLVFTLASIATGAISAALMVIYMSQWRRRHPEGDLLTRVALVSHYLLFLSIFLIVLSLIVFFYTPLGVPSRGIYPPGIMPTPSIAP